MKEILNFDGTVWGSWDEWYDLVNSIVQFQLDLGGSMPVFYANHATVDGVKLWTW